MNTNFLKVKIKTTLRDQFIQKWNDDLLTYSKYRFYKLYKTELKLENYLVLLTAPLWLYMYIVNYVHATLNCPMRKGSILINVPRERLYNTLCTLNLIGDEYHLLFECNHLLG